MPVMQWKRGEFHKFYAQMKIRIGGKEALDILAGDEFEFDGTIVKYAGAEFSQVGVRGAITQDWAILDPDERVHVPTFMPTRDVAKSQSKNTDLSRVQRNQATVLETNSLDEETVINVSDRRPGSNTNPKAPPRQLTQADNRRVSTAGQRVNPMQITASDYDSQEGVIVGKVRSAAKIKVEDITKDTGLASALENRPLGRPELYAPKKQVTRHEGITITSNSKMDRSNVQVGQEDEGTVVGKVRHSNTSKSVDGIEIRDTSNIRNEGPRGSSPSKDPIGANGPIQPRNVKTVKIDKSKLSEKHKTALLVYSDFPLDWNFVAPVSERLARAKERSDDVMFLKALYVVEGDNVKKQLKKAFPKVFG